MFWGKLSLISGQTEDRVLSDFETRKAERPFRCCLCNQLQKAGTTMVWVGDSAKYFRGEETYESLVIGSTMDHRSGACMDCVRRYK